AACLSSAVTVARFLLSLTTRASFAAKRTKRHGFRSYRHCWRAPVAVASWLTRAANGRAPRSPGPLWPGHIWVSSRNCWTVAAPRHCAKKLSNRPESAHERGGELPVSGYRVPRAAKSRHQQPRHLWDGPKNAGRPRHSRRGARRCWLWQGESVAGTGG